MKRKNKYNAIPTTIDGIRFASKREAKHYSELRLREKAGELIDLNTQPKYQFVVNGVKINSYTADFSYTETSTGDFVVEDVKSPPTAKKIDFRRNCKMMKALYNIDVQVVL
ncbi:MAG: hypothetical protein COA43_01095 [Robiginitomaculum sp.]|nr:MAG: hypothetical protein COA43_01095 [Robiginitomaculum sp.]